MNDNHLNIENVPSLCKQWESGLVARIIASDFKPSARQGQEYEINPIIRDALIKLAGNSKDHVFLQSLLNRVLMDNVHNEKYHEPLIKLYEATLEGTGDNSNLLDTINRSIDDLNKRIADSLPKQDSSASGGTQFHNSASFM